MELPSDFLRAKLAKQPPVPSFPEDHTVDDNKTDTSTETDSSTTSIQTVTPTYPKCLFLVFDADDQPDLRTASMDELLFSKHPCPIFQRPEPHL